jgi:hypothetical protein
MVFILSLLCVVPLQAPVFDVDSLSLFPFLCQVGGAIDKNFIFHRMRETRKLTKMEMIPMIDDLTGGKLHLGQPGLYVMLMLFLYQCSGIKLLVSASYLPLK